MPVLDTVAALAVSSRWIGKRPEFMRVFLIPGRWEHKEGEVEITSQRGAFRRSIPSCMGGPQVCDRRVADGN